ncbi:MAG TPA: alpha/beta hydrolase [Steroidobacteraceae bacterium]|nr:alpha/beta hydrolase [Steroidobacteraceae bacterium]
MRILLTIVAILVILLAAAWLKLRGPDIPYSTLEAKYAGSASRFVDLPGGLHMHYEDEGQPAAPLLVLLHGYGDSYTTWDGWVRELKDKFHIIRPDFPGHGLTRAPSSYRLDAESLADLIDAFAARLELPKFAVAGNSMGGGVAWEIAVRHPQRLDALILVDAAGFPNEKPQARVPLAFRILRYRLGRALLRNIDNRPLIEEGLKADVYDQSVITPAFVDRWAELQRAPGHREILMSVNPAAFSRASAAVLGAITVPTLVVNGENDILIEPASARKFAAAIPRAKLILYPKVGHLPQIEIPGRSSLDVAQFLLAPQ